MSDLENSAHKPLDSTFGELIHEIQWPRVIAWCVVVVTGIVVAMIVLAVFSGLVKNLITQVLLLLASFLLLTGNSVLFVGLHRVDDLSEQASPAQVGLAIGLSLIGVVTSCTGLITFAICLK